MLRRKKLLREKVIMLFTPFLIEIFSFGFFLRKTTFILELGDLMSTQAKCVWRRLLRTESSIVFNNLFSITSLLIIHNVNGFRMKF
jgi:hypothetical protein